MTGPVGIIRLAGQRPVDAGRRDFEAVGAVDRGKAFGLALVQQIRKLPELADLPLIAVTAKAMKGDRQKCLDAGASDYIAKPVDIELLLALLRVWVARARDAAASAAGPVPEAAE